ncbi:MAG TPA: hypothetical protein PLM32_11495, partial [Candidatus Competibacter sp.]|nr:hypothetical protein [Candidatus Competibacter sp.]
MSTYVLFFGGYRATITDMKVWQGSAKAQKSDVEFDAIPWPSGASYTASSAVGVFTKTGGAKAALPAHPSSQAGRHYLLRPVTRPAA